MSVNDGLSDEEWGAWGKTSETAVTPKQDLPNNDIKLNNGFGSDEEISFNTTKNVPSKFSYNNYNREGNVNNRSYEKRGGFNGNRFASRQDNDAENKYKTNYNDDRDCKRNGYSNDKDYQNNYRSTEPKKNGFDDYQNNNRNNDSNKCDDSRENRNSYRNNRKDDYKRDNSRDHYRNNDRRDDSREEHRSYRYERRDNSRDRKDCRDDYKRDGSRENKSGYRKRDDSRDNERNSYRKSERSDVFNRDDSRENRNNYRSKRNDSYDRDDFRDNQNSYSRKDEVKRDDSKENRNRNYKKDDSKRDDSQENRKGRVFRESERNYRDKDDNYKRDGSRDVRKNNDRNREFNRDNSLDDFRGKNQDSRPRGHNDNNGYKNIANEFESNLKIDDEGFSSRTFVRGRKISEKDNQMDDSVVPVVKRATFIPNDDQEDYELHVNSGINFDNYDKIPVEVTGDEAPAAISSFIGLNLPRFLVSNIENLKYSKLTPVQKYAIPIIDAKRDLMACAQTGSGKTAAFLIPIIKSLNESAVETPNSAVAFPKALIMAPTRELCRQIFTAARQLCRGSNVKCAYIYGGIEMNKSRRNIQASGCDILVATPGRLIHFLELVWLSLKYMKFFVLDEADRMLESEGFYESVNKIYTEANCIGEDRTIQISMFSATFPNEIQSLARNLLKDYLFLAVGVVGSANSDVKQEIIQADQRDKVNTAIEYIKTIPDEKTLIFVESKRMADFFGIKLGYLGFKATTIHGDREQEQREIALNDFKSGRVNFMVATNVAARGLDIPKVDNVINIDMPGDIDTYVHRIGRTGRCGNVGRAISFFDEMKDIGLAQGLVSKLQEANQECADWLKALCDGTGVRKSTYSRDTRKDVKMSKYVDNPADDGFMKGTNIDYDDVKPSSEWLED